MLHAWIEWSSLLQQGQMGVGIALNEPTQYGLEYWRVLGITREY